MNAKQFKKKALPILPIDKLIVLKKVFTKQRWIIDDEMENSRFVKYIKLLNNLNNDEQNLILELTERFTLVEQNEYLNKLTFVIKKLLEAYPDIAQYYILPALSQYDLISKEVKSSHTISYLFKGDQIETRIQIGGVRFHVIKSFDRFVEKLKIEKLKRNEKILFVDDFIGSGETALNAVKTLSEIEYKTDDIVFLTIVAHEMGINTLKTNGYNVFYSNTVNKGISDYYSTEEIEIKLNLMKNIEDRIPTIEEDYRFGYRQCEALVCMHRIPNNTFPIYWLHKGVSPFKR